MIRILFIVALLFTACSPGVPRKPVPEDLIAHEDMVDVIAELSKYEGHIVNQYQQLNKYYKVMTNTGDSLLKVHGYTHEQFERSIEYYGAQQQEMKQIYTEALEKLNEELGELEANHK